MLPDDVLPFELVLLVEEVLRECAAYGLGCLISAEAFQAYKLALSIDNSVVRLMLLRSLKQSYARLDKVPTSESEELLVLLINYLFKHQEPSLIAEENEVLCLIIGNNMQAEQEEEIVRLSQSSPKDHHTYLALNILINKGSPLSNRALSSALKEHTAYQPKKSS